MKKNRRVYLFMNNAIHIYTPLIIVIEEHQRNDSRTSRKKSLDTWHINYHLWSTLAENRNTWRLTTNHVVSSFENIRKATLKDKKRKGRNCNTMSLSSNQTFSCGHCDIACLSCIGLISQEDTSSWRESALSWSSFHEAKP